MLLLLVLLLLRTRAPSLLPGSRVSLLGSPSGWCIRFRFEPSPQPTSSTPPALLNRQLWAGLRGVRAHAVLGGHYAGVGGKELRQSCLDRGAVVES